MKYACIFKFINIFYKNSVPAPTRGLQNDFWSIHTSTKYSITWNQSHHGIESARDLGLYICQKWPKPSTAVMGLLRVYIWDPRKLPPLAISRLWRDAGLRNCMVMFNVFGIRVPCGHVYEDVNVHFVVLIFVRKYRNCDCVGAKILNVSPPSMSTLQSSGGHPWPGAACYIDLAAPTRAVQPP